MKQILKEYGDFYLNLRGKVGKDALWLMLAQFVSMFLGFVSTVILTKILDKNDFATYKFALSLYPFFALFSLSGLSTLLLKKSAREKELQINSYLYFRLFALATLVPALAVFVYFTLWYLNLSLSFTFWFPLAIILALSDIFYLYAFYLKGREDFTRFALFEIMTKFVQSTLLLFFAYLGFSVYFLLALYSLTLLLLRVFFYLKVFSFKATYFAYPLFNKKDFYFALNMTLALFASTLLAGLDKWLVVKNFGQETLSDYVVAALLPLSLSSLFVSALSVAFPKFVHIRLENKKDFFNLLKKIALSTLASVPLVLVYVLLAPVIFRILFANYYEAYALSIALATVIPFYLLAALSRQLLIAKNDKTHIIKINLLSSILLFAVFWVLKDSLELFALPWAIASSLIFASVLEFMVTYKKMF